MKPAEDAHERVRIYKTIKLLELLQKSPYGITSPQQIALTPDTGHSEFTIYQ